MRRVGGRSSEKWIAGLDVILMGVEKLNTPLKVGMASRSFQMTSPTEAPGWYISG